jgi:hypothetical protein
MERAMVQIRHHNAHKPVIQRQARPTPAMPGFIAMQTVHVSKVACQAVRLVPRAWFAAPMVVASQRLAAACNANR